MTIQKILLLVVVAIIIIGVILLVVKSLRERVADKNRSLPPLDEVKGMKKETEHVDKVTVQSDNQLDEAMSISSDDEFDRSSYIKENKSTSLEDDFGTIFETPQERAAKAIKANTKKVVLPKVDKPTVDSKPVGSADKETKPTLPPNPAKVEAKDTKKLPKLGQDK